MEMEAIGFLELNSIAKGIRVADVVLKTANVKLLSARASCPGKYYLLFAGEVRAVQASLNMGTDVGGEHVVDHCLIARIHPQVIRAINMCSMPKTMQSIGVMEFFSATASIYSADAAIKSSAVELVDVRLGTGIGGKSFVILTGELAAVTEAVNNGIATPNAEGMLISSVVIPSPSQELLESLM